MANGLDAARGQRDLRDLLLQQHSRARPCVFS